MADHLTPAQIERYVSRRAPVDEILSAAQHLDECFDCRDRAAALVDPGTGELGHTRHRMTTLERRMARKSLLPWVVGGIVVLAVVVWLLSR